MLTEEESSKLDSLTKIYTKIIYEFDQELFLLKKNNSKKVEVAMKVDERDQKLKDELKREEWSDILSIFKISRLTPGNIGTFELRGIEKFSLKSAINAAADEVEVLFCTTVICQILKEEVFKNEVKDIAKQYDFTEMKPIIFIELLNSWQDLQSTTLNILISPCKYKISDSKKRHREIFASWNFRIGGSCHEIDKIILS